MLLEYFRYCLVRSEDILGRTDGVVRWIILLVKYFFTGHPMGFKL